MKHLATTKSPDRKPHFFSNEIYGQILDSIVIGCADSILTCNGEILLTKRNIDPLAGHWWIVGGRMEAGEDPVLSAQRKLLAETALPVSQERFKYIETYSTFYPVRNQEPKQNGSHTMNITYWVDISPEERTAMELDKKEFRGHRWIKITNVHDFLKQEQEDIYLTTVVDDFLLFYAKQDRK